MNGSTDREIDMVQAVWNGVVIAESDRTVQVEGNHYFPRASVKAEYLVESSRKSTCPWIPKNSSTCPSCSAARYRPTEGLSCIDRSENGNRRLQSITKSD